MESFITFLWSISLGHTIYLVGVFPEIV